jgi:hypothetical protein
LHYFKNQKVTEKYGKNFTFYKQHWISHVIEDIEEKGTTDNYVARPGEGFHQEVQEAWDQTNNKDTDKQVYLCHFNLKFCHINAVLQMTKIDANQEVIALIRTTLNLQQNQTKTLEEEDNPQETDPDAHWALGSPLPATTSHAFGGEMKDNPLFHQFHSRLLDFF